MRPVFLALRELRRAKARFGLLVAAVGLLVFLILTQQALQDGLLTSFVGAIRSQSAPVLVYSVDGQRTLQGSVIPPDLERTITEVDGVGASGRIGQGTFTATVDGGDEEVDAAVIGADDPDLGGPEDLSAGRRPEAPGEAVGSAADYALGDVVRIVPAGSGGAGSDAPELTVVGLVEDAQIQVSPTLFVAWDDYEEVVLAANPDAREVLPSVIGVAPEDGVSEAELVERINDASADADALTRQEAADEAPGVSQVRQSFQVLFLLYGLVVPLVMGLFFLIITFQKAASLTLLRAIGARSGTLVRSLLVQVLIVIVGGLALGTALYAPLSQLRVGSIALRFDVGAVVFWSVLLLVLGLLSAVVAARRVLAIDPIEATTGGGAR
ncbi:FtsX-like permease family protein [Iamia sp. SCSIO 61187]|uniref:FtsX-like permease family protein n=1 Tax=Iamia sp. SCSIO 61187 TaxID=2722752 RepID=UPI00351CCFB0